MKPMIYKDEMTQGEILAQGTYNGYDYVIVSYGSHPCAYVRLPENHVCIDEAMDCDTIPVECHYGLTFLSRNGLPQVGVSDGVFIGWDYSHFGDYCGLTNGRTVYDSHKWTTEEIFYEVKNVISQLEAVGRKTGSEKDIPILDADFEISIEEMRMIREAVAVRTLKYSLKGSKEDAEKLKTLLNKIDALIAIHDLETRKSTGGLAS